MAIASVGIGARPSAMVQHTVRAGRVLSGAARAMARHPSKLMGAQRPLLALPALNARATACTAAGAQPGALSVGGSWAATLPAGGRGAAARAIPEGEGDAAPYDGIIVLAGGYDDDGLPEWVTRRLQESKRLHDATGAPVLCTGGGTPHRPPLLTDTGHVIHESTMCAEYLIEIGMDPAHIIKEWSSFDTIGNGYYSIASHVIPLGWRKVAVITSDFHMPRSQSIFEVLTSLAEAQLPALSGWEFDYVSVTDDGIDEGMIAARTEREAASLGTWRENMSGVASLAEFSQWLHLTHRCYAVARQDEIGTPTEVSKDANKLAY